MALLAELGGECRLDADTAALAAIERPALDVMAEDSAPERTRRPTRSRQRSLAPASCASAAVA